MGYYLMPVRAEHDEPVDDWVVWSTYSEAPAARGTRAEVSLWWKSIFGSAGLQSLEINSPFDRADEYGSSEASGVGRWGETISVHGFGILNGGQLDRDKLPAFIAAVYPRDAAEVEGNGRGHVEVGREVRALVTPFDPAEDPEIDTEVWKIQVAQAIADFEGAYDADPDLA
jgi:hypothetical protein